MKLIGALVSVLVCGCLTALPASAKAFGPCADATGDASLPGNDLRRFMGSLLNFPALRDRIPALVESLLEGRDAGPAPEECAS